jgi:hypothetical protein
MDLACTPLKDLTIYQVYHFQNDQDCEEDHGDHFIAQVASDEVDQCGGMIFCDEAFHVKDQDRIAGDQIEKGDAWQDLPMSNHPPSLISAPTQNFHPASPTQRPVVSLPLSNMPKNNVDHLESDYESDQPRPSSLRQLIKAIQTKQVADQDGTLEQRMHDFERARSLRRDKYRKSSPSGILGMYQYLSGIRMDLQWAEQAAARRSHGKSYMGWADYTKEHERRFRDLPIFIIAITILSTIMLIYTMYLSNWEFAPTSVRIMEYALDWNFMRYGQGQANLLLV